MAVKKKKATFWEFFQGLGKTFMLPVALLAFMGILLGLGSSFSSESMIETIPFLGKPAVKLFSNLCRQLVVLRLPIYLSCLQWPFRWG